MLSNGYYTDITGGYWLIGADPESNSAGVTSADPAGGLWPHQVRSWKYVSGGKLQSDPQLTVTGNIDIYKLLESNGFNNKFRATSPVIMLLIFCQYFVFLLSD